jgi:hypothetical protein
LPADNAYSAGRYSFLPARSVSFLLSADYGFCFLPAVPADNAYSAGRYSFLPTRSVSFLQAIVCNIYAYLSYRTLIFYPAAGHALREQDLTASPGHLFGFFLGKAKKYRPRQRKTQPSG